MGKIEKIFKVKTPIVRNFSNPNRQSVEATEDYSVKKNINTVEGTIEHVPTDANHIANKAYVDSVVSTAATVIEGTSVKSTGELVTKYLRADGDGTSSWQLPPSAGAVAWGDLSGTVSDQADLQTELDGYDTHVASTAIHFTEASLSIPTVGVDFDAVGTDNSDDNAVNTLYSGLVSYTGTASDVIDTHIASTAIHYTEASIDHVNISSIGTNTHAQIDTHIASTAQHYLEADIDIPASQISDFDTEVSNNTSVVANTAKISYTGTASDAVALNTAKISYTGTASTAVGLNTAKLTYSGFALDHGTAATDMIVNVCYGTQAAIEVASAATTTIGSLYIQYTA